MPSTQKSAPKSPASAIQNRRSKKSSRTTPSSKPSANSFQPVMGLACALALLVNAQWDGITSGKLNAFCEATGFQPGEFTASIDCLELRCPDGAARGALDLTVAQIAYQYHCVPEASQVRSWGVLPVLYREARDAIEEHQLPLYMAAGHLGEA